MSRDHHQTHYRRGDHRGNEVAAKQYTKDLALRTSSFIKDNLVVILFVTAVVAIAVMMWLGYDVASVGGSSGWPRFALSEVANALILGVIVGTGAYSVYLTSVGDQKPSHTLATYGLFVLALVLLSLAFWLFFKSSRITAAFWLSASATAVAGVMSFMAFKTKAKNAFWTSVPFVIGLAIVTYLFWLSLNYVSGSNLFRL